MIDITQDIQPLTAFRNNSGEMMKQLKRTGRPIVLTVHGKTETVDDVNEAIRQGRADVAAGRTVPVEEGFAKFRRKHGLSH